MSEFRWRLMKDGMPDEGKGDFIVMGARGAMYYANEFSSKGVFGHHFSIPNNRAGLVEARSVKAWAEIPPLEASDE